MTNLYRSILIASVSLGLTLAQEKNPVTAVSLIEVLANAEKFDGRKVAVTGFLVIERDPLHFRSTLFFHEEDAKHFLGNSVIILASDEMQNAWEKISSVYVSLVGTVQVVPSGGGRIIQIRDIERCIRLPSR